MRLGQLAELSGHLRDQLVLPPHGRRPGAWLPARLHYCRQGELKREGDLERQGGARAESAAPLRLAGVCADGATAASHRDTTMTTCDTGSAPGRREPAGEPARDIRRSPRTRTPGVPAWPCTGRGAPWR